MCVCKDLLKYKKGKTGRRPKRGKGECGEVVWGRREGGKGRKRDKEKKQRQKKKKKLEKFILQIYIKGLDLVLPNIKNQNKAKVI